MTTAAVPKAFIWRRLQSLMGLWLVIFLSEHLLTNSQAALWIGDRGAGFVRMVDMLHRLPYLHVIEVTLLGIPFLIHLAWGIRYALQAKFNSAGGRGKAPVIKTYRNHAYSWQRITSWILAILLVFHIVKFRFLDYPEQVQDHYQTYYAVKVSTDPELQSLARRWDAKLYTVGQESSFKMNLKAVKETDVIVAAKEFGTATLFSVRDTFKSPFYIAIYTIFVLAACFHAYNGFWTFLITWGWVLKMSAQRAWTLVSVALILLFAFLGLSAVWGSYLLGGG